MGKSSYHETCTRCVRCDLLLEEKCFEKGGLLYCEEHYFKWAFCNLQKKSASSIDLIENTKKLQGVQFIPMCRLQWGCESTWARLSTHRELYYHLDLLFVRAVFFFIENKVVSRVELSSTSSVIAVSCARDNSIRVWFILAYQLTSSLHLSS